MPRGIRSDVGQPVEVGVVDAVRVVGDDVAAVHVPTVESDRDLEVDRAVPVGQIGVAERPPLGLLGLGDRPARGEPVGPGLDFALERDRTAEPHFGDAAQAGALVDERDRTAALHARNVSGGFVRVGDLAAARG